MTRRLHSPGRTARSPTFGDPTRRGHAAPVTAAADAFGTLLGFALFALVASALAPFVPPVATLLALWFVGLPAAFAVSVGGVDAVTRLRRRLRRFACAHWRAGCEHDSADAAV